MQNDDIVLKNAIIQAAVSLYMENRSDFTLRKIAQAADCDVTDIQRFYPGKQAILRGFYDRIPDLYHYSATEISDYNGLTLGEKLGHYIYTSFDALNEQRDFTEETFQNMVMSRSDTKWHVETALLFEELVQQDDRVSDIGRMLVPGLAWKLAANEYFQLIRYWLQDDSENSQRTLALVDKMTAFVNEIFYTTIADKGFDLIKYLASNNIWKFRFQGVTPEISDWAQQFVQKASDLGRKAEGELKKTGLWCKSDSNDAQIIEVFEDDSTQPGAHSGNQKSGIAQPPSEDKKQNSRKSASDKQNGDQPVTGLDNEFGTQDGDSK
jgi:AcrR family transcriptional regulator